MQFFEYVILTCKECKHFWIPRKENVKKCPRCNTKQTNNTPIKIEKALCKRCGHSWVPRKGEVFKCPRCQSFYWDKDPKF